MNNQIEIISEAEKLTGSVLRKVLESWKDSEEVDMDDQEDGIKLTLCGLMTYDNSDDEPYFRVIQVFGNTKIDENLSVFVSFLLSDADLKSIAKFWADIAQTNIDEVAKL
jgi:hypothetical protein